ncbi:MAG TPA: NAD(P)H-hydrate dehydratase [Steroidobacteraceae bacterium]|nr:NAD(P)H-hydrate dehydratase [Steroidobacteraceae bacterium]
MLSEEHSRSASKQNAVTDVDTALLTSWPLPDPDQAADKDERGSVLLVGGSNEMPGAILLSALAAMRAGAGKLCIASAARVSHLIAQAVPESRVIGLAETQAGGLRLEEAHSLPERVDAVLVGPGMLDEEASVALTHRLFRQYPAAKFVLDTLAMSVVREALENYAIVVTPHPGEMAHLTKQDKDQITHDLQGAATRAAEKWRVVVALKSSTTLIAHPDLRVWCHKSGTSGLAVSGSGDVLAGIITALCARGASIEQATVWGVALHARCGNELSQRIGPVGFLAREIPDALPGVMRTLSS